MKKRTLGNIVLTLALLVGLIGSSMTAMAMNDTATKDVYIMGKKVATIEARIWAGTGATFDATSSSWITNANVSIRNHVNQMELAAGGLGVGISVPTPAGSISVSYSNGNKTATFTTRAVSGSSATYRGINTYSNRVTGIGWWVNCSSMQSLELDTQPFFITASCFKGL